MKTLKCVLLAALFAIAMAGYASADEAPKFRVNKSFTSKIVKISFSQALMNPGLVNAMQAQLSGTLLSPEKPVYVARVSYDNKLYLISGTYEQWSKFLGMHWKSKIIPFSNHPVRPVSPSTERGC